MSRLGNAAHALAWKEWRQLRAIRWAGVLLAALIVVMCLIYGASGRAPLGLFGAPTEAIDVDSALELALWAVLILLWPLIAAMSAVQGFSADRTAGTQSFVWERPVPGGGGWTARLLAVLISCVLVALVAAALVLVAVALFSTGPVANVLPGSQEHGVVWKLGAALLLLALGCALAATAFRLSGFAALLVSLGAAYGLVAALGLVLKLMLIDSVFGWPPAAWLGVVVVVAAVAASWAASARGEPAGRRRLQRAAVTLAAVLLAGLLVTGSAIPRVMRSLVLQEASARAVFGGPGTFFPAPDGNGTLVRTKNGLLVIGTDEPDGREPVSVRIVAARAFGPVWNPDGTGFAAWSDTGPLGFRRLWPRLTIFDRDGRILRTGPGSDDEIPRVLYSPLGLGWCDEHLVALMDDVGGARPYAIDPVDLTRHRLSAEFTHGSSTPLLTRGGRCWWVRNLEGGPRQHLNSPRRVGLFSVTAEGVSEEPELVARAGPWSADERLSLTGRYWLDAADPDTPDRLSVRALSGDETWLLSLPKDTEPLVEPTWIGEDLLTWILPAPSSTERYAADIVVHAWSPGPDPAEAHPLALPGQGLRIQASPGDRWLLVSSERTSSGEALIDRDTGAITHLDEPLPDRSAERLVSSSFWIDDRTLGTVYEGGPLAVRHTNALDDPEIIPLP